MLSINNSRRVRRRVVYAQPYGMLSRIPDQVLHMSRLFLDSEVDCISNLRMDRNSFGRLYFLMRELGGLVDRRYISVEEQVFMFLSILPITRRIESLNLIVEGLVRQCLITSTLF
ncbi:hypothetical protein ACS0TY_026925 [Phlomoides rotata]